MTVDGSESTERWFVPACAGLIGGVGMIAALGPRTVHPANADWLMQGDFGLHFFGWHLYRSGPWTLPIGATPHLIWPVGSSVGLTDAIPVAAIVFKLFDHWLPPVFQFIGLWLVICFALQGIFGVLLMRLVTPRPFMVVVLMLAAFSRQVSTAPRRVVTVAAHAGIAVVAAWLALWQSGSLMVPASSGLSVGGFGQFSANLLTFVMPTEWRTLLTPGPFGYADPLQYEGYAYMGLGALLLGTSVIVASAASGQWRPSRGSLRRHLALMAAVSVLALMAVGPTLTAGRVVLFEYDPRWWGPFTIFRTSGRMIWPLFYATLTAILFRAARLRYSAAVALLTIAVALQAVDLAGMSRFVGEVGVRGVRDPLNSPFWRVVPGHYERLILVPSNLCGRNGAVDATPFLMVAARERLPINAGATARYDMQRAADYCEVLAAEVRAGAATPGSLYVIRGDLLLRVAPQAEANGATCISVDGFGVCYEAESARAWKDAFPVSAEHRWR